MKAEYKELESFTFYRSYYNSLLRVGDNATIGKIVLAIARYALEGEEPSGLDVLGEVLFESIRPNIDASNRRKLGGKRGGEISRKGPRTSQDAQEGPETVEDDKFSTDKKIMDKMSGFEAMRADEGSPVSPKERRALLKRLQDVSGGDVEKAAALIDEAIDRRWKTFFDVDKKKGRVTSYEEWGSA